MCTVSIVPAADGFRVMSNRDERRDRSVALQPRIQTLGARSALLPTDPIGGGSWIGVNDAGLVAAVLNRHADSSSHGRSVRSRGLIVRHALASDSIADALTSVLALDAGHYRPFRLVLVQNRRLGLVVGNGRELAGAEADLVQPYMFTASSLGDVLVDSPRRRLFEYLMEDPRGSRDGQLLFHHHQWTDKREISVVMEREDAATVSRTLVDVAGRRIALEYESLVPSCSAERFELQPC